jgi:hypothetical protein
MAISVRGVVAFLGIILLFLLLTFDPLLGQIFLFATVLGAVLWLIDYTTGTITYPIEKASNSRIKSLIISLGAVVAFYVISSLVLPLVSPALKLLNIGAIASLYSQYTPVFAGNVYLTSIAYSLLIPIAESFLFFVVYYEFFDDRIKDHGFKDIKTWGKFLIVSALFMVYHIQSKYSLGKEGFSAALLMVFIMAMISLILVKYTKQGIEAINFHVILNTVAIVMSLNLITAMGPALLFGALTASVLLFIIPNVTKYFGATFTK